jgi:hypothetical protein
MARVNSIMRTENNSDKFTRDVLIAPKNHVTDSFSKKFA